jgi:hypothetical protein
MQTRIHIWTRIRTRIRIVCIDAGAERVDAGIAADRNAQLRENTECGYGYRYRPRIANADRANNKRICVCVYRREEAATVYDQRADVLGVLERNAR